MQLNGQSFYSNKISKYDLIVSCENLEDFDSDKSLDSISDLFEIVYREVLSKKIEESFIFVSINEKIQKICNVNLKTQTFNKKSSIIKRTMISLKDENIIRKITDKYIALRGRL